jgi:hypothetical protein
LVKNNSNFRKGNGKKSISFTYETKKKKPP